ncbi:MAG TPA: polysaccharide biosynthesis/export family protein [Blastocatellia bacterium]|nr:polysaccharide biosynthesis/export family protein [Blastocatellia bacterium]
MNNKFSRSVRKFYRFSFLILSFLSFWATLTVRAQTVAPQPRPEVTPVPGSPRPIGGENPGEDESYRVGPGDLLDIRVFGHPELGREARITNQGRVRLPFIDELQVACRTEAQIAQLIVEKYRKYLRDPQIDVFVKEYKSQPVAIIGAVSQPGRFQLQRRARLLELLTFAGGPNPTSGGVVNIIRGSAPDFCGAEENSSPPGIPVEQTGPEQALLLSFKLPEVIVGQPESNPFVRPGDIISVPETDQVFVIGYVVKPGAIAMRNKITLLQAVGMAGGFLADAAKGKVKVVRQEPGTNVRKEYLYNIDHIQKKQAEDVVLMPNDVIDVPASVPKNTVRGLLGVGVNMIGTLPYWVIR